MRINYRIPTLPRNPLLRALLLAGGAVLLAGLLTVGLVVGTVVLAVAVLSFAIRRWLAHRQPQHVDPSIIDGEFTVVETPRGHLPRPE